MKPNYFPTLNAALASEDLIKLWPLGSNINYGETVHHIVKQPDGDLRMISIYRENQNGMYERPVHYNTTR